jgi:membrane protease YdiL (CAAX protease family)
LLGSRLKRFDLGPVGQQMKAHQVARPAPAGAPDPAGEVHATDPAAASGLHAGASGGGARPRWRLVVRTLGSLLLGAVAILGPMVVFRQGLLPLIDTIFGPGPAGLSAIRRTGLLLAAIGGYFLYVRWHEKRRASELRLRPVPLLLGAAGGALLVGLPIALLFALGAFEVELVRAPSPALLGVAVLIGIAATLEELVHRALLFRVLERFWGTLVALVLQAVLFAVPHFENLEGAGGRHLAMMLLSVSLLGLLWAAVFVLTRNLWVAAANHAAWNFTILLSGVPLSGIEDWRPLAPLETRVAGPDWLTGGIFGPESSVLVIAAVAVAVVLLLRRAGRQGAFRGSM